METHYEKLSFIISLFQALLKSDETNHGLSENEKDVINDIVEQYRLLGEKGPFDKCTITVDETKARTLVNLYQRIKREDLCKGTPAEHNREQQKGIMYGLVFPIAKEFAITLD